MHIHILGICGTFMAGIASIAKQAGHTVTGCDKNVYPPMSDFLNSLNIDIHSGYDKEQLDDYTADIYIIGNVMTRGYPIIEAILDNKLPYTSGPEWLYQNVLRDKKVIAIAGTHGKTTTSSMVAWLLEAHGLKPGFLIGGMPENFNVSARLGEGKYFVIEADEYDTAFFDKRSKFILYRPDIVILNNIEFDHADIFNSLDDIKRQFHHLVRCVPSNGQIIYNSDDKNIIDVLNKGAWSPLSAFGSDQIDHEGNSTNKFTSNYQQLLKETWQIRQSENNQQTISQQEVSQDKAEYNAKHLPIGKHNQLNALAAILSVKEIGVAVKQSLSYFKDFKMPKRRLEVLFKHQDNIIYRDFAHHPTAIKQTIATLKQHHPSCDLIAVIEMRSNSMKKGVHDDAMTDAIVDSNANYILAVDENQKNRLQGIMETKDLKIFSDSNELYFELVEHYHSLSKEKNICLTFLTNGNFDGISEKFTTNVIKGKN